MSEMHFSKCEHCPKPKTIHLTQIIGGKVTSAHLCSDCPKAKAASELGTINIAGGGAPSALPMFGTKTEAKKSGQGKLACPRCGFTKESFKEFGRLGCPSCYEVFADGLESVLQRLHRGSEHRGKRPKLKDVSRAEVEEEIKALRVSLREHVEREEYEEAALLRDRIRELECDNS